MWSPITYVVLVGLQRPLQRDGQLLVDLMDGRLDLHLDAPLGCFHTILPHRTPSYITGLPVTEPQSSNTFHQHEGRLEDILEASKLNSETEFSV